MNVYDQAHDLARAIKESNEFLEYDRMRKEIENDTEAAQMIAELQQLQLELQTAQMAGNQPPQDAMARLKSLSTMAATKPAAARYLQAQGALSVMINDVFQIIYGAVAPSK